MKRYLRLLALQFRISLVLGAQYRWDFLINGALSLVWTAMGLVPLYVALHDRPAVEGWRYEEALVVVGWFTVLKGILDGAVNPSLTTVVEHIRKGTLDFVLMKPADAQFLVSTAKFEPWKVVDFVVGAAIVVWAFVLLGRAPSPPQVLLALGLLAVAVAVLYTLWILVIAAAFWVVRLDNLSYMLSSLLDFGRWPVTIFKGIYRLFFTLVIPLGLMTTYPAEALLGRLVVSTAGGALASALAFTLVGRLVWMRALGHYTSASS